MTINRTGAITNGQFDGAFAYVPADQLRAWDVLFEPVRQVLDTPHGSRTSERTVRTSIGTETHKAADLFWTFRPALSEPADCPACGQEQGQPCDPTICLGLAFLEDTALDLLNTHPSPTGTVTQPRDVAPQPPRPIKIGFDTVVGYTYRDQFLCPCCAATVTAARFPEHVATAADAEPAVYPADFLTHVRAALEAAGHATGDSRTFPQVIFAGDPDAEHACMHCQTDLIQL